MSIPNGRWLPIRASARWCYLMARATRSTASMLSHRLMASRRIVAQNAPTPPAGRSWAYALLTDDLRVQAIVDGMFVNQPITPPENGWVLVADGQAALQLERLGTLGVALRLETEPTLLPIADSDTEGIAVFVNPLHPEVRARLLALIRELCLHYPIDGLVLDRLRWANVYTDFSELSRAAFEARYGRVANFPDDILRPPEMPRDSYERGPRFGQWVQFRAEVIRDLLREIRRLVDSIRPIPIGAYVGSWYPVYYEVGVNWGSDALERPYAFVESDYRFTSYLFDMDYLMPGCYFNVPFMAEAPLYDADEVRTVEGMTRRVMQWTNGDLFVYAGIYTDDYRGNPVGFERAMRAARLNSHGVMIFDASQIVQWDWWEVIRRGLGTPDGAEPPLAPHQLPSLLTSLRQIYPLIPRSGPLVSIYAGPIARCQQGCCQGASADRLSLVAPLDYGQRCHTRRWNRASCQRRCVRCGWCAPRWSRPHRSSGWWSWRKHTASTRFLRRCAVGVMPTIAPPMSRVRKRWRASPSISTRWAICSSRRSRLG
jgi:hypothetical protein